MNESLIDALMVWVRDFITSTPVLVVLQVMAALFVAMALTQASKAVLKEFYRPRSARLIRIRRWLLFFVAYVAGFQAVEYFVDSPGRLSVLMGFANPIIYLALVQYAIARKNHVLLAVLKGRRLRQAEGCVAPDETASFLNRPKK